MRRISSPVAGMKAPYVFSGTLAEAAATARGNYSLFNRREDLAKEATQAAHSSLAVAGNGCGSRSEISASVASFAANSGRSKSAPKRQRQFPSGWLGTFIRASLPSPSGSCIGTRQRLATELEAARIIAQLTPSSHRPRYAATCWRSYSVAPDAHQPSKVSLSCVPVYTTLSAVKV